MESLMSNNVAVGEARVSFQTRLPFLRQAADKIDGWVRAWQVGLGGNASFHAPCCFAQAIRQETAWLEEYRGKAWEQWSGEQLAFFLVHCWYTFMRCYAILEEAESAFFYGSKRVTPRTEDVPMYHRYLRQLMQEALKVLTPASIRAGLKCPKCGSQENDSYEGMTDFVLDGQPTYICRQCRYPWR